MEDKAFGERLALARRRAGYKSQAALGNIIGLSARTIRSYESGKVPDAATLDALRRIVGPFDADGDAVEVAVRQSALIEWRQDAVLSTYKRHLYEQREPHAGTEDVS
jgi:transcriptional regulator with XRE-family HTH domain